MQELPTSVDTGIIIIVISFLMLLIGMVLTYFWIIRRHFSDIGKIKKFDDQIAENINNILRQARAEAEQMRNNASLEAQKIIDNATNFHSQRDEFINQELKQLQQTYKSEFEQTIIAVQNKIQTNLSGMPEEIINTMRSEMEEYRNRFREELSKALFSSKSLVEDTYKKLQEDLEVYKQQRYKQLDDKMIEIVKDTSVKVLGKQLSIDEHEKIVLKTLEEAKRQNII